MKRILVHSLLLSMVLAWPTGLVLSGPPRSWDRMSGEIDLGKWVDPSKLEELPAEASIAQVDQREEQQRIATVNKLKSRLETDRERLSKDPLATKKEEQMAGTEKAAEEKPATPGGEKTLKQLKDENSEEDVVKVEWVGKDRRLKRVKKTTSVESGQLYKPSDKLIVTDRYHKSVPELLSSAELRQYGARPGESSWSTSSSKFLCEIRHSIPGFGYAVFKRGIGEPIQFAIESYTTTGGSGPARVSSIPPTWKHYAMARDLGMVPIERNGNTLFSVASDWAGRLMLELEEGMIPTFAFWDEYTAAEDIVVKLSPFKFKQSLPEFNQCMGNLLPYSFNDVQKTSVQFGYDKATVDSDSHARLKKIAEYVKLDKSVKYVEVTGYSDSVGFRRYNKLLAEKRATAVKKFLLDQGLEEGKVRVKAAGEEGKKHSNRTEAGRRKNRRVEISLVK